MKNPEVRWWDARGAQNLKPSTYRCPLCGELLPALSQHMLLFPEGDHSRRRHAHTACVLKARQAGSLPTKSEWEQAQPRATKSEWEQAQPHATRPAPRWSLRRWRHR